MIEDYIPTGEVTLEFVIDEDTTKSYVVDNVAEGSTLEALMGNLSAPKMEIGGEGTTELNPPTTIVWKYTTFEEAMAEKE